MACACKVNQDLTYLQKKYGVKGKENKKTNIRIQVKIFFEKIFIGSVCLIFSPFFLLYLIFNRKKVINVNNLMNRMMHPFKKKSNGK